MNKLFLVLLTGCVQIMCAEALTIIDNAQSTYQVVVAPDALPITLAAADDLILYIHKSTGVKLPLVKTGETGKINSIVVGDCRAARNAGILADKLKPESYVIRSVGKNLYIVGRDTAGRADNDHWYYAPQSSSWFAVSTFLQKYLDIRWFMPGDNGEYVPKIKKLIVPEVDISDSPGMTYRRMGYLWRDKDMSREQIMEAKLWKRRNKDGWSIIWRGWHVWLRRLPTDKYFKDHPEWYALVNGRRLEYSSHGAQICSSSAEVLDTLANDIINDDTMPNAPYSLVPNDGKNHCECAKCRALDVEKLPDGNPVLSDRYVRYCNEVAKRVLERKPQATFAFLAYSYYSLPPRREHLHPSVKVMLVRNGVGVLYYSPKVRKHFLENELLPWSKATDNLLFSTHPEGDSNLAMPCFHKNAIKYLFADLADAGVCGISMNNQECVDASGLNNYLYEQMAWNPRADIDAIYTDAIGKCYGNGAAPYVTQYFELVETLLIRATDANANGIKEDMAVGTERRYPMMFDTTYRGLYEKGMPLLDKAASAAVGTADSGQKFRLQMLIDNLKYCRDTVALYDLSKKVLGKEKKRDNVLKALNLANARQDYLNGLSKAGRLDLAKESLVEKEYHLPFSPEIYRGLLNSLEGVKVARATYVNANGKVKIDGIFDEPCWETAESFSIDRDNATGAKTLPESSFKILYDDKYIYFAVTCQEPDVAKLKDSCREADGPVWRENNIDLFFGFNGNKDLKHLIINSLGTVCDIEMADKHENIKWTSGAKVVASKNKDRWNLEFSIPLKNLTGTPPGLGSIWSFNICRIKPEGKQYIAFSPTFGLFANPDRFGKLVFK